MLGLVAAPAESSAKVQASAVMHAKQHQVIAELKAARALLEKPNHDYQGHRAKAVTKSRTPYICSSTASIIPIRKPRRETATQQTNRGGRQEGEEGRRQREQAQ